MDPNIFTSKKHPKYYCEKCEFKCFKLGDWNRHILTNKHKTPKNPNEFTSKNIHKLYNCKNCEKKYKHMSTLCAHIKKCSPINDTDKVDKDTLIHLLLTQNNELMQMLKNGITTNNNTTNNNTNNTNSNNTTNNNSNNSFNLNIFLNETCKDAMNISEFVSSIKVSLDDLENTGRKGYIEGISNIIVKKLNNLEQHFRPIHCSDYKREVFYIKDNNEWTKETDYKPILTKAIKIIANENIKQIQHWRNKYPDCINADSKKNNLYLKIVSNSMNGLTEEEGQKNINKIISNVAKEVIIDKHIYRCN
jgi:hypothetical protein